MISHITYSHVYLLYAKQLRERRNESNNIAQHYLHFSAPFPGRAVAIGAAWSENGASRMCAVDLLTMAAEHGRGIKLYKKVRILVPRPVLHDYCVCALYLLRHRHPILRRHLKLTVATSGSTYAAPRRAFVRPNGIAQSAAVRASFVSTSRKGSSPSGFGPARRTSITDY